FLADESAVNIALIVRRHDFRPIHGNEPRDVAISGAANPDALLDAGIVLLVRLRVRHVNEVFLVNIDATGSAKLLPLRNKSSILVENLNTVVGPISNEQPPIGVHCKPMGYVELAGGRPFGSPLLGKAPTAVEFNNPRIRPRAMSVRHEHRAIRRDQNIGRSVERVPSPAAGARLSERQQHAPIWTELRDRLAFFVDTDAIRYPNVSIAIDEQVMRPVEHAGPKA